LQKNINTNKDAIDAEIAERTAKDVAIEQALSAEANTRYTEDERLQKNINANKDAIEAEAATRQAQVDGINQRLGKMNGKINKVGAGAATLAALHPLEYDPDDKLTFAAGVGNYAGENAAALGAFYRPDEKLMFSLGGTMGNGENMVNLGVSIGLDGASGTPKLSKKELVQKVNTMEAENQNMKAEIAELKALVAELAKKK
ncbi:MAG: YadA C-terminal domain-containing protein, partial [Phascolarctobacterium sp.]|nr:YadA C-terminal domain-containing protein [Phascolarctobacterium sp.]